MATGKKYAEARNKIDREKRYGMDEALESFAAGNVREI